HDAPPHALGLRFFFQAEDGIRDRNVTGVQTCALPICSPTMDTTINVAAAPNSHQETAPLTARRGMRIGEKGGRRENTRVGVPSGSASTKKIGPMAAAMIPTTGVSTLWRSSGRVARAPATANIVAKNGYPRRNHTRM